MTPRDAIAADRSGIADLHRAAFPTDAESRLVADLIADDDVVLSLVMATDDMVIAHVLFSRMRAEADGISYRAAALAPIAVRSDHRRRGLAAALIESGIRRLAADGVDLCFVLGSTSYYPRFGFTTFAARPFASDYAGEHFMALWLRQHSTPLAGHVDYPPAFGRLGA